MRCLPFDEFGKGLSPEFALADCLIGFEKFGSGLRELSGSVVRFPLLVELFQGPLGLLEVFEIVWVWRVTISDVLGVDPVPICPDQPQFFPSPLAFGGAGNLGCRCSFILRGVGRKCFLPKVRVGRDDRCRRHDGTSRVVARADDTEG